MPDVHDEADFDIPDAQAVLERFMSHMSKLADVEYQVLSDLVVYTMYIYCSYQEYINGIYH